MRKSSRAAIVCTYCDGELLHCHGVAIVSEDGAVCSEDPDCAIALEFHHFVALDEEIVDEAPLKVAVNG